MVRWVRRALAAIALIVIVGGGVLFATAHGSLDRTRKSTTASWAQLRPALDARYLSLAAANHALASVAGPDRTLVAQVDGAITAWQNAAHAPVTTQVTDANTLEALGRELVTTVDASPRLRGVGAVQQTTNAYATAALPAPAQGFARAVRSYERARGSAFRRPVVALFGYDSIPGFDASPTTTA